MEIVRPVEEHGPFRSIINVGSPKKTMKDKGLSGTSPKKISGMDSSNEENQFAWVNTSKLRGNDLEFGFQDSFFGHKSDQNCSSSSSSSSSSSAGPLYYNGIVADINETFNSTMESYQLPDHPSDSITFFKKLRINLNTLHIDIFDRRFIDEWGQFVPYAIAKSCSRNTCQLGKFLINLEDTGFAVSKETQWRTSREKSIGRVVRSENSQIIVGTCGGDCGGCWPDPFLLLDVIDLKSR
ncbi:unnamed protein product [Rodentolepis nana]|uniref:GON domain-containing protein n=1 Tax=Rodentolepis nana TaxID=102285 RepID=A0A3P7RZI2_RODNA|nr:unnamed protein product [Rodentolepis nana]